RGADGSRELLRPDQPPRGFAGKDVGKHRSTSIRDFDRPRAANRPRTVKFFPSASPEEQRRRFLERIDEPAKRWKFSMDDVAERKFWDKYMEAYEDMIRNTSRDEAPWYVVPADNKWFARLVVAAAMVDALESLELEFPTVEGAALKELERVRGALLAEGPPVRRGKVKP